jgi:glutamyl-tRNA synthetase
VAALGEARGIISGSRDAWRAHEIEAPLRILVEDRGWKAGDLFMAIRVAVTGRTATPPLFDMMVALGYERTLARLDRAIAKLAVQAPTP